MPSKRATGLTNSTCRAWPKQRAQAAHGGLPRICVRDFRMPTMCPMHVADQGRQAGSRFAGSVASQLPDQDDVSDVGRARAQAGALLGAARRADRLPDRDDVNDVDRARPGTRPLVGSAASPTEYLPERGRRRRHGRSRDAEARPEEAGQAGARKRLPDWDNVDDAVSDGRKRVQRLADDARETRARPGLHARDALAVRLTGPGRAQCARPTARVALDFAVSGTKRE